MTNTELQELLTKYVGRRVRISSHVRGGGQNCLVWRHGWPVLSNVDIHDDDVWCHSDDGVSWLVVSEGLKVEAEPAVGTFDFAGSVDQMTTIGTILNMYGSTPRQQRDSCACKACQVRRMAEAKELDKKIDTALPHDDHGADDFEDI
jgi:hypothetical protein